jgi:UDP-glucose 4-epimerase
VKALVTGATGFIGARLLEALRRRGDDVVAVARNPGPDGDVRRADLSKPDTLADLCTDVEIVFHLAGYAHADDADDPSAAAIHQGVTVDGTRALLREARRAGVKCFVFASSVKAMSEGDTACLDETSNASPTTAYGRAERDAETLVLAAGTDMHVTVLRLPLVYGPSGKGNIARLIAAIDRGRFPPLPPISNKRSMVHVDDVVQALLLAADRKQASGSIYIVTDDMAYSISDMCSAIRRVLGRPVPRWSVPVWLLKSGALAGDALSRLRGKPFALNSRALEKLLGSAWYSPAKIRRELGFEPRHSFDRALPDMVAAYHREQARAA